MGSRLRSITYFFIGAAAIILSILLFLTFHPHRQPYAPPLSDACGIARLRLIQSSDFSNAYRYRDAYDAAVRGLKANAACGDRNAEVVNKAFLLSTKAISEHFVSRDDSSIDLSRAIRLLERCQQMRSKLGPDVSERCKAQEQGDIVTQGRFQTHQISLP